MIRLRLACMVVAFIGLIGLGNRTAQAQRSMDGPPIDRILGFLDRNRNGEIDPEEFERMPGPFRDAMNRVGIDGSRSVGIDELERLGPQLQEELRRPRDDSDGGRGRFGDRGRSDRDDRRDSRRPSSRRPELAPRPKVTLDLPESHRARDKDGDRQIGLYEWDRATLPEFFKLDRNRDGFITPRELVYSGTSATATTSLAAGAATATATTPGLPVQRTAAASTRPTSTSSGSPSPSQSEASAEAARYERFAQFTFRSLDQDRDGKLTSEEWERSRRTKAQFEQAKVTLALPATYEQFKPAYVQVRTAAR